MEEGTGKATSQRKEPTPWQAGGRVAPKGQSDSPEAAGHRKRVRGPVPASLKTAVTYGGDLSREVMGWTGQAGESPPPSPPPPAGACTLPPLDLTWCVGITGAEGMRCKDSRLWRSRCSSCSFP